MIYETLCSAAWAVWAVWGRAVWGKTAWAGQYGHFGNMSRVYQLTM